MQTSISFIVIGVLILLYNLFSVSRAKPVELLYAAHKGDGYHSFVGLKAFLGILCIGGAYAMIFTTPSPIEVVGRVFPIAFLILIGTQFFFSFCSVVLLQTLKRNEKYYYRPQNFISVSGLIYRLKQNAKGLSNICILSTAVMVIATTTLALYIGVCQKWQALFCCIFMGASDGSFFRWRKAGEVRGIQDSGDYGGDWRGYYEALHGAFKGE